MRYTLIFIALSLVLTACRPSDAKIQRELTGTWVVDFGVVDFGGDVRMTNTVSPDGSFEAQIVGLIAGKIIRDEGTLISKDGVLICTETKSSEKDATVPSMIIGHIINLDAHELNAKWAGSTNPIVARKVER